MHFHSNGSSKIWYQALCKKCPYSEFLWPVFSAFGLNTERYSVRIRENTDQKTLNTDTFHAAKNFGNNQQ